MNKQVKRELVITALLIIITVGGVYGGITLLKIVNNTETPTVVVISESMEPNLLVGDICLIRGVPSDEISIGDIIVFQATWRPPDSYPVIHRVVNITEDSQGVKWFTTKGDNPTTNPVEDPEPVPENRIVGVVILVIPRIGLISIWLMEGQNFTLVVVVLIFLIFATTIHDLRKRAREQEEDQ